jgi:hypothetical protein
LPRPQGKAVHLFAIGNVGKYRLYYLHSPSVFRLSWDKIPRVKAKTGRNSLDILQELRAERV